MLKESLLFLKFDMKPNPLVSKQQSSIVSKQQSSYRPKEVYTLAGPTFTLVENSILVQIPRAQPERP